MNVNDGFDLGAPKEGSMMRAKKTVEKFGDGPRDDEQDDYKNPDEPESEIECLISWYVKRDWSVERTVRRMHQSPVRIDCR